MSINIIAAIGLDGELGAENKLLCHLPNDLRRFKELTLNSFCVMGRNTFESLPATLPKRHNIILTRNKKYKAPIGTYVYHNLHEVIEKYHNHNNDENDLWIIGGSEIYYQALEFADKIYLTVIESRFSEADVYFPRISLEDWKPVENIANKKDDRHPYNYSYITYERHNKR